MAFFSETYNEKQINDLNYNYLKTEILAKGWPLDEVDNVIASIRLKSAMQESGITSASELVEKSGVNKGSVSQYINGLHVPSSNNAKKLSNVLGVNPLWLMAFDAPRFYSGYTKTHDNEPLHEKIIEKFDKLDDGQKQMVLRMLGIN